MSKKTYLLGIFDDEQTLLHAIGDVRGAGYSIHDVLTPFPVHGMEDAMGWDRSRIPVAGFIFGMLGTITAISGMSFIHNMDWQINYAGKPFWAIPSFIPITFELTVLFSAIGMFITFLVSCGLSPGAANRPILHKRATDDQFVLVFDKASDQDLGKLTSLLNDQGAIEVKEKTA